MDNLEKKIVEKKIFEKLIFSTVELEKLLKTTKEKDTKIGIKKILKTVKELDFDITSVSEFKVDNETKKALHAIFSNGMSLETLDVLDNFRRKI